MKSAARVLVKAALTAGMRVRVHDDLEGWFEPTQTLEGVMREVRAYCGGTHIRLDDGTPGGMRPETAMIVNDGVDPEEEVADWSLPRGEDGFISMVMEKFFATV